MGGADPRRSAVRQKRPVAELPVCEAAARRIQAGYHRHADGEQPGRAVGTALHHGARPAAQARPFHRLLPKADREGPRRGPAGPTAPPNPAADAAPPQVGGRRRTPGQTRTDRRARAESETSQDVSDLPAKGAAEGPRSPRRPAKEPLRDLPLADATASGQPRPEPGRSIAQRASRRQSWMRWASGSPTSLPRDIACSSSASSPGF